MRIDDQRRHAPATARNRDPILEQLKTCLPARGLVLEVGSGTGEHACHFAAALPGIRWQPSDPDVQSRQSIAAWTAHCGLPNILPPLVLDVLDARWPVDAADAVVAINLLHISPPGVVEALMRGAAAVLPLGGPLAVYGPFLECDVPAAPSNLAFDQDLRRRNPAWGLRDLATVSAIARTHGLALVARHAMPANNLFICYVKNGGRGRD